jgi:hypothetical protein
MSGLRKVNFTYTVNSNTVTVWSKLLTISTTPQEKPAPLKIPSDLLSALEALAEHSGISTQTLLRDAIEDWLLTSARTLAGRPKKFNEKFNVVNAPEIKFDKMANSPLI